MTIEVLRTLPNPPPSQEAFGALYATIQQFYAHQMQLFDDHDAERWAGTFTEDAVFCRAHARPAGARPCLARGERAPQQGPAGAQR
ncbi:nuclear transport factor 2 family protein [Streptomyces sp. KL116D]|uniref:nuclear transport factor 2 family protein n=1 Tax=Streptomyces sp. KL116D TaxID=3045152 RepID=UPI003558309D